MIQVLSRRFLPETSEASERTADCVLGPFTQSLVRRGQASWTPIRPPPTALVPCLPSEPTVRGDQRTKINFIAGERNQGNLGIGLMGGIPPREVVGGRIHGCECFAPDP